MKTKHLIIAFLSIILISVFDCGTASAQSDIDRIVNEIENKGADVNSVIKRNKRTKRIYLEVKSVSFLSRGDIYARQLIAAFDKDSQYCDNVSKSRNGSDRLDVNINLIFREGKMKSIYSLSISGNRTPHSVSVSIVKKDVANEDKDDDDDDSYIIEGLDPIFSKLNGFVWDGSELQALNYNKALKDIDWPGFNRKMDESMKQWKKSMKQSEDSMKQWGDSMKQWNDTMKRLKD